MFNKGNLSVAEVIDKGPRAHFAKKVLFYAGGTVATNGHLLVSVSRPDGDIKDAPMIAGERPTDDFGEFTLDVESIKKIKKGFPKSGALPILQNAFIVGSGDKRRLVSTDLSSVVSADVSDGDGPPDRAREVSKLVPDKEPLMEITFNAESLIKILGVIKEAQGEKYAYPVTLKLWSDCDPVRMDAENQMTGQKIEGLIMPFKK